MRLTFSVTVDLHCRSSSDSALHTSVMGTTSGPSLQLFSSPYTFQTKENIAEMVGENMGNDNLRKGFWDPKQMPGSRPKSCEVPNINIYPSAEQENHTGGVPVPITNNTGSLPDLTVLHFPPPLTTPLDAEDQNYGAQPANLSPTSAHHVGMVPQQSASPQAQSPAQRRRPHQGGPSPLVLSSSPSQQMRMPHSPPVSPSLSHYRNSVSENCQSPTSPHSQPSYSPSQSPDYPLHVEQLHRQLPFAASTADTGFTTPIRTVQNVTRQPLFKC
uniref:CREB-regulated transcription coactivator 1-like isoform X3 n=1 Tax=Crassostrea virginica TaxID=6565 RepID=A0A8B8DPP1_CRAVI|nr:CREB-regulated transcription coactivator 1-like isoform X3 [Crassostrea virginica]